MQDATAQFRDETILCCQCSKPFLFTAGEQQDFDRRGFVNKPKRCRVCRENKKNGHGAQKSNYASRNLADRDLLVELCKAVNELHVLVANRLDALERKLEERTVGNG